MQNKSIMHFLKVPALDRMQVGEFARYFMVSVIALASDMLTFSVVLRWIGMTWVSAATAGFLVGVVVAYQLSVRFVFADRVFAQSAQFEFVSFAIIGVCGLGVTQLVLWVGIEIVSAAPELAKLMAAGVTFIFNYAIRKILLFRNSAMVERTQCAL